MMQHHALPLRAEPRLEALFQQAEEVILGKPRVLRLAMTCLLARGHLVIEDLPGMGKTTLAHLLATLLGLDYQRIQFTSDLLPADIVGVSIYDRASERFHFHPGPVFAQLVLADEINRATPKTQSALLEAMEELQVTAEGETRPLPEPFFVIATQNPAHQVGTFPLPESQLDRFLMRIELGYPDAAMERLLLKGAGGRNLLERVQPVAATGDLARWQEEAAGLHVADALLDYVQALVAESRTLEETTGLSPRAGLALLAAARAWAWLAGREQVLPEDVQAVWMPVTAHRLGGDGSRLAEALLQRVAVP
ncbi:MAG TPA: AAA family ATPase [Thiolapillus brandeum]|uniref:AAA family ATPase n=1 Tax=Thiolapillus brandeum TaxID=1076588 RepID=A0A7C5IZ88_9GAMM|nr:AAA family ATPase [Thiolapillus brandeum]